jgi:acyl-CoA thioesterase-2
MTMQADPAAAQRPMNEGRPLLELLELERTGDCTFVAGYVFPDPYPLFGGQVAAQALRAAGLTLADGRSPHSLHGYFLRSGDASVPMELEVEIQRDGRSFSSRRVTAIQAERTIFTMSASFHLEDEGPSEQRVDAPSVIPPTDAEEWPIPRLFSFEGRAAEQDFPLDEMRSRFWARCTADLADDRLLNACAVAYFADITNPVAHFDTDTHRTSPSLDYSMWFHRPVRADRWMLLDLVPHTVARGRGWYTGSVFQEDGTLVASLAQETLFREGRPGSYFPRGL